MSKLFATPNFEIRPWEISICQELFSYFFTRFLTQFQGFSATILQQIMTKKTQIITDYLLFYVEQLFILLLMFKKLNRRLAPKTEWANSRGVPRNSLTEIMFSNLKRLHFSRLEKRINNIFIITINLLTNRGI